MMKKFMNFIRKVIRLIKEFFLFLLTTCIFIIIYAILLKLDASKDKYALIKSTIIDIISYISNFDIKKSAKYFLKLIWTIWDYLYLKILFIKKCYKEELYYNEVYVRKFYYYMHCFFYFISCVKSILSSGSLEVILLITITYFLIVFLLLTSLILFIYDYFGWRKIDLLVINLVVISCFIIIIILIIKIIYDNFK